MRQIARIRSSGNYQILQPGEHVDRSISANFERRRLAWPIANFASVARDIRDCNVGLERVNLRWQDKSGASLLHLCGWFRTTFVYGFAVALPYATST